MFRASAVSCKRRRECASVLRRRVRPRPLDHLLSRSSGPLLELRHSFPRVRRKVGVTRNERSNKARQKPRRGLRKPVPHNPLQTTTVKKHRWRTRVRNARPFESFLTNKLVLKHETPFKTTPNPEILSVLPPVRLSVHFPLTLASKLISRDLYTNSASR